MVPASSAPSPYSGHQMTGFETGDPDQQHDADLATFLAALLADPSVQATPDARLHEDLGLDSLQKLEMLAWIAARGVSVSAEQSAGLHTVAQVTELLATASRHLDESGPTAAGALPRQPRAVNQPPPLTFVANGLALRPLEAEHVPFLYYLATSELTGFRWRFRGAVPSAETFQTALTQGVMTQFVVVLEDSGEPVGEVVAYNADHPNGTAYVAAVFRPDLMHTGLPVGAFLLFLRYLFQVWNFRKVYLEMPSYNFELIASGTGRWFDIEGRLRDFTYYAGQFWDEYLLAICRHHIEDLPAGSSPAAPQRRTGQRP